MTGTQCLNCNAYFPPSNWSFPFLCWQFALPDKVMGEAEIIFLKKILTGIEVNAFLELLLI